MGAEIGKVLGEGAGEVAKDVAPTVSGNVPNVGSGVTGPSTGAPKPDAKPDNPQPEPDDDQPDVEEEEKKEKKKEEKPKQQAQDPSESLTSKNASKAAASVNDPFIKAMMEILAQTANQCNQTWTGVMSPLFDKKKDDSDSPTKENDTAKDADEEALETQQKASKEVADQTMEDAPEMRMMPNTPNPRSTSQQVVGSQQGLGPQTPTPTTTPNVDPDLGNTATNVLK